MNARECAQCRGAGEFAYPGDGLRTTRCGRCHGAGFIPVRPQIDQWAEGCRECGAPFNDGDTSRSGLCPACEA